MKPQAMVACLGLVLVILAWHEVLALQCSTGIIVNGNFSAGATVECSDNNPQCVEFRGGITDLYQFYFCVSLRMAGNELYGSSGGLGCGTELALERVPCMLFCSSDNCNTDFTGSPAFPPTTMASCYNGLADSKSGFFLRGGVDSCNGLCVTHMYEGNATRVFGCAPFELPTLLGASDMNSCVVSGDLITCFCTSDLCNNYFTPYPKIDNPHRCYSGFGFEDEFYGSVEQCQPDEVCAGIFYGGMDDTTDIYQCMKQDTCISYWGQFLEDVTAPCRWEGTSLVDRCCCAGDLCNFNPEIMSPDGSVPTPNPATNNNNLECLDAIKFTGAEAAIPPIDGELRPCSGACAYASIQGLWKQWRCLDVDVCAALETPVGTCKNNVIGIDLFCCYANETATTAPVMPTSSGNGSCPQDWTPSKSFPGKCYRITTPDVTYTNWAPGEPHTSNACVSMERARGLWSASQCLSQLDVACELFV